jgi:hypothetical protein
MRVVGKCLRRIWYLLNRRRMEEELQSEMDAHRTMMGEPARFGNTLRLREESRDAWGWAWLDDLWMDLRYGFRQLRKAPALTVLCLITLAIGIGANTALFSILNAIFLSDPPVRNPELMRQVEWAEFEPGIAQIGWINYSYPVYRHVSARSKAFSDVLCLNYGVPVNLRHQGTIQRASADFVSGNFFQALGARQVLGRLLVPSDDRPEADPVAVIDDWAWQQLFGGDKDVINRTVSLNGMRFVIVGVMPQKFEIDTRNLRQRSGGRPVFRVPISHLAAATHNQEALTGKSSPCRMIGILRPDAGAEPARVETEQLVRQAFAVDGPIIPNKGSSEGHAVNPESARVGLRRVGRGIDELTLRDARRDLPAVLSVLLLPWAILLIPCANLAGMLLARASARRGEIATRLAIGAARRRMIRQLLTESVLLAVMGGGLAVFLCYIANRFAIVFEIPFALDLRVLVFTAGLSVATGLLFGLVPSLIATRIDLISVTKQESASGQGRSSLRAGKAFAAFQVTLSFLLLIIAGLQVRSLLHLMDLRDGSAQLQRLPDVASVSVASMGVGLRTTREFSSVQISVGPGYFETMNVRLLMGRDLEWTDRSSEVVVVNEAFGRRYFPDSNPLGKIVPGFGRIVGIVENSPVPLASGLSRRAGIEPTAYVPLPQKPSVSWLLVRAKGNPSALIEPSRRVLDELDSEIPVNEVQTLVDEMSISVRERRWIVGVFSCFGLIALLQSACGIYGTMSYFVSRRTPEIGLRMALGAARSNVVRLVIRQSIVPVVIGMLLGSVAVPVITIAMRGQQDLVVGTVTATDQLAIIGSVSLLVMAAILAAWAPAWRASRIDPMRALRHD